MTRLKLFILVFWIGVSIPLGYVMWRTYESLAQEERSQVRFFSETLFDQMEKSLADLVQREENRAVDEYGQTAGSGEGSSSVQQSPLTAPPAEDYILGYFQNNPDGSFQTPLVANLDKVPADRKSVVASLKTVNLIFNRKKFQTAISRPGPAVPKSTVVAKESRKQKSKEAPGFADRFLRAPKSKNEEKAYLGKKKSRIEEITAQQAMNLSRNDDSLLEFETDDRNAPAPMVAGAASEYTAKDSKIDQRPAERLKQATVNALKQSMALSDQERFQVEVAPFQSVYIQKDQVFIFRRIAINNQIYRQGFVLLVRPFLSHLIDTYFNNQPLADFTSLRLQYVNNGKEPEIITAGRASGRTDISVVRTFPAPFDFINAALSANDIPTSQARRSVTIATVVLGAVLLLGMLAIYHSARTVVDLSERRSQFVSSVTHELKTPLTNIRMYIEMLEQGIAATPEREQAYLRVLGSESARLSGLINNVLDLAKLEKKQRHFHMQEGRLEDVLNEVSTVMGHKLSQEKFTLHIEPPDLPPFTFDRDVLIQILINLIENSVKFGKQAADRHITIRTKARDGWVSIAVADKGPGIPRHALKKVFDDFYRVDNDLTRKTGGTGIGLALVKKFITAMGGRVQATNNDGPGCTITLFLPYETGRKTT